MTPLDALGERFGIAGAVRFETGSGGLVRAVVTTPAAAAHVYLHGAHLTHYAPLGQKPLLFMSPESRFESGRAIRGGVPVIFPWFGPRAGDPSAPEHGFARTAKWSVESVTRADDGAVAFVLGLETTSTTRASWPFDFHLRHRVVVGPRLEMELCVENRSAEPFSVEEALHTYLLVGDVREITLSGLGGATYIDKLDGMRCKAAGSDAMRFTKALDRVFLGTRTPCVVDDPVLGRRLVVEKSGSATTVVWNPWSEKARAMADLGSDAWRTMLCVETANVAADAVHVAPGGRHLMTAVLRVEGT